jgi:hypothetical protein
MSVGMGLMGRAAVFGVVVVLAGRATAAPARPDEPGRAAPEYKVAFWYDRSRPVATFQHKTYDLRKGEYPAEKVERWLARMAADFPRYAAYVKDVHLDREPGANDQQKLAHAIQRELKPFVEREIQSLRLLNSSLRDSSPRPTSPSPGQPLRFERFDPGRYAMPRPSFPQPVPYPRPHP